MNNMNDLLTKIKDTITKEYNYRKFKHGNFILTESGRQASCREVIIRKTNDIVAYKFDKEVTIENNSIKEPFLFLSSGIARSKCDYILFYPFEKRSGSKIYVFVCNLKSRNIANNDDQLKSGEFFSEFLIKTAIRCFNHDNASNPTNYDFKNDVKIKKVLFANLPNSPKGYCKPSKRNQKEKDFLYFKCSETCDLDTICN